MRTALIGLGAISATHIAAINNNSFTTLCAVCDIDKQKVDAIVDKQKNVVGYTDYKKMIDMEKPDFVHICTPHFLHREMAVYALEAGCHVYLEKPAAMNADEAQKISDASKKTGKKVCVSFQNRVIPTNAMAKEIADSGKYGKLLGIRAEMTWSRGGSYYTDSAWRGRWETEGGGVLMNQSIHTLDLMYYIGGKVKSMEGSVALRRNKKIIEVEDTAEATIWFENGAEGIFYATNCNFTDSSVQLELFFEKASLFIYRDALYLNTKDGLEKLVDNRDYTGTEGKACWGNGHAMMMKRFYDAVGGSDDTYCDIDDAIPVLRMIGKIYETSKNKLK